MPTFDPDERFPVCPQCGAAVAVTCMAWFGGPDPNHARCGTHGDVGLARECPTKTRAELRGEVD